MSDHEMTSIIEFSEDISTAEKPPLLPRDTYPGTLQMIEPKIGVNSGKAYGSATVVIAPDAFPPDFEAPEAYPDGVMLTFNRVPLEDNPNSRYRLRKFCERFGVVPTTRLDLSEFSMKPCRIVLDHEVWEGEERMVARDVLSDED